MNAQLMSCCRPEMPERLTSVSVIVPAYNEQKYLPPGIEAMHAEIARARQQRPDVTVEVLLVNNASTDRTEELARQAGYRVVYEEEHKIARVRNAGAAAATGQVLLTIDADSRIGEGTICEAIDVLEAGAIGGGCAKIRLDRRSALLNVEVRFVTFLINSVMRLGAGIYFCRKDDFDAIGGFNEELYAAEDLDFAIRLKEHGHASNRPFINLKHAELVTSARKIEFFGRRRIWLLLLRTCWRPNAAIRRRDLWQRLFYDVDKLR